MKKPPLPRSLARNRQRRAGVVAKLCGADVEQGNFILGRHDPQGTGADASRALLREIDGLPLPDLETRAVTDRVAYFPGVCAAVAPAHDPQDWGRKFLPSNGGACYVDLNHLEVCIPEVRSAHDHVAAWHAMLRLLRRAQVAANGKLPPGHRLQVLVNNSDGLSHSYGSHLSFLLSQGAWDTLFNRKLHHLLYLASFQASSIVLTGQGKVGAENGTTPVAYQISQRADFFETLCGVQTTERRPLVNSRQESLCGERIDLARLHCIFFDSTLCHGSSLLKVGLMQLVLALIEAGEVDPFPVLEDPVGAVRRWSRDPGLRTREHLVNGGRVTAVELQRHFLGAARRFARAGGFHGIVARAGEIIDLWHDTLRLLEARDFLALGGRLDWVLKLNLLRRALQRRPDLTWASPEIKHLDQLYGSLDPETGLYWGLEASGVVERLVDEARVRHFTAEPPEDTRAWLRAQLLRLAPAESVCAVDWDAITVRVPGAGLMRFELPDPRRGTRAEMDPIFRGEVSLPRVLRALGAMPVRSLHPRPDGWPSEITH